MGTFARYTGKMDIPEEKRECFGRQMMKILNYGGMMQFEKVLLFGHELLLLSQWNYRVKVRWISGIIILRKVAWKMEDFM